MDEPLAACARLSACLPAADRAAYHRAHAHPASCALVQWVRHWLRREWLLGNDPDSHRQCVAMFEPCEGTEGGPADA